MLPKYGAAVLILNLVISLSLLILYMKDLSMGKRYLLFKTIFYLSMVIYNVAHNTAFSGIQVFSVLLHQYNGSQIVGRAPKGEREAP